MISFFSTCPIFSPHGLSLRLKPFFNKNFSSKLRFFACIHHCPLTHPSCLKLPLILLPCGITASFFPFGVAKISEFFFSVALIFMLPSPTIRKTSLFFTSYTLFEYFPLKSIQSSSTLKIG